MGAIRYAGGPRGHGTAVLHAGHVAVLKGGVVVNEVDVRRGHRFRLRLAHGSYRVRVTSGDAHCPGMTVAVKADQTRHLRVVCSIR